MTTINTPEGVTLTLNVYLMSEEELEAKVELSELHQLTGPMNAINVEGLVESLKLDAGGSGWRVMTRAEIADYRRREIEGEDA